MPRQAAPPKHPFAMLRHDFAADPRLSDGDVRVLVTLMYWARDTPDCWPSIESIGRRSRKKDRAVRTALKNLEHFGYVRSEPDPSKAVGRRIVLVWVADGEIAATKEEDSPRKRDRDRMARVKLRNFAANQEAPVIPIPSKQDLQSVDADRSSLEITLSRDWEHEKFDNDVDPSEAISEDRKRDKFVVAVSTLAVQTGRQQALAVNAAAKLIAELLMDQESLDFHRKVLWKVAKGQLTPNNVKAAFLTTYGKILDPEMGVLGSYYVGCLRNMIGDEGLAEFMYELKLDADRAKIEYACRDNNLLGSGAA